jgi:ABC-2 type transport system ATP-binding protein
VHEAEALSMRIEAEQLGRRFAAVQALRALCFRIESGRRVALIGPNGSGKSTLNRILMGLLRHDGWLRLDGCDPLTEQSRIAPRIAYVPQIAPQLAAPVRDVIGAVAQVRALPVQRVIELGHDLDLDMEAIARRPFRALSGGMKQKLLIALALAARARLLILDEPTGSLDPPARERFHALFEQHVQDATLLLCSHRLDEIRPLVDHVLLLQDGSLAYQGSLDAFVQRCARTWIDVRVASQSGEAWLRGHGFSCSATGSWHRIVDPSEKMKLLPELLGALGACLTDLNVRDLESLDLPRREGRDG